MMLTDRQLARFWAKVDRRGDDECWPFRGYLADGYGRFSWRGRGHASWPAHRVAYLIAYGSIDPELIVRHRCDNPPCVNPAHLEAGTKADNARDREERGRGVRVSMIGSLGPRAKLTEGGRGHRSRRPCRRRVTEIPSREVRRGLQHDVPRPHRNEQVAAPIGRRTDVSGEFVCRDHDPNTGPGSDYCVKCGQFETEPEHRTSADQGPDETNRDGIASEFGRLAWPPGWHYEQVPVVDGIATLPGGQTVRTNAAVVRFPVFDGPADANRDSNRA